MILLILEVRESLFVIARSVSEETISVDGGKREIATPSLRTGSQ